MTRSSCGLLFALACAPQPTARPPTSALEEARTAVAFRGDAPDDGRGIHVAIGAEPADCGGERPFVGAYTELGLQADLRVPSTIAMPSYVAEAFLHAGAGDARVIDGGVLHLEGYDERGLRGRFTLNADGETHESRFDAGWCGDSLPLDPARSPEPLGGLDLTTRAHQLVVVEGFLVVHDGQAVLASELQETFPPRAAGTLAPLDAAPAMFDAVATAWSERTRGSSSLVVVEGQVRGDRIVVHSFSSGR